MRPLKGYAHKFVSPKYKYQKKLTEIWFLEWCQ